MSQQAFNKSNPGNHVMVDLETLGTRPNSLMLTIGAVRFNPWKDDSNTSMEKMETFYRRVSIDSFEGLDHVIDDATLEWWGNQSEEVREEAFAEDNRHDIRNVLADFHRWCGGLDAIWANGTGFDLNILEHFSRELKRGVAWNYWQARDARTLYSLVPGLQRPQGAAHHALWDCWSQVVGVQRSFAALGINELHNR
jgi:DNA polymerase III epsilon subunit-like protein